MSEVHDIGQFFVPIFFVAVGAAVDLRALNPFRAETRAFLLIALVLTAVGVIGKLLAGYSVPGRGLRRSVIGVGMIPRGEVGLIFAQIGLSAKLLSSGLYSALATMVMLTTLMTPLLLRWLLPQAPSSPIHGDVDLVVDAPMDERRP